LVFQTGSWTGLVILVFLSTDASQCLFASALGVYNGRVYESLWERALADPLNCSEVTDAYEVSKIKPHCFTLNISPTEVHQTDSSAWSDIGG